MLYINKHGKYFIIMALPWLQMLDVLLIQTVLLTFHSDQQDVLTWWKSAPHSFWKIVLIMFIVSIWCTIYLSGQDMRTHTHAHIHIHSSRLAPQPHRRVHPTQTLQIFIQRNKTTQTHLDVVCRTSFSWLTLSRCLSISCSLEVLVSSLTAKRFIKDSHCNDRFQYMSNENGFV